MSLKDTILKHIARQGAQDNPVLRVDQETGWIERVEPDRPIRPAKATKPAALPPPELREKFHKKGSLHRTNKMLGYDTFSLALIWPQAATK